MIERYVLENRKVVKEFLNELGTEGYKSLEHIAQVPQGYLSKLVHTVAHLLDGFFGIDSRFYNLEEESHWVSPQLYQQIKLYPGEFWIIEVAGFLTNTYQGFEKAY